jgi:hypothetical protein
MSKIKNLKRSNFGHSVLFRAQNALCGKTGGATLGYGYLSKMECFFFVPNMYKLSKSEPTYPHSILMQESKDMREKNIEPEIYREVKVTNNGWCVLDRDL